MSVRFQQMFIFGKYNGGLLCQGFGFEYGASFLVGFSYYYRSAFLYDSGFL